MVMIVNKDNVTFTCYKCNGSRPCIFCSMEESVYILGYKDGKLMNPKDTTGFNRTQTTTYLKAYNLGLKDANM